jgi:Zonular occludens toxin (Zot)
MSPPESPAPINSRRASAGGRLDPSKPVHITIVGKKGSGKTEVAYNIVSSFPRDKATIDPNGDLKVPDDVIQIGAGEIPDRWPGERLDRFAAAVGRKQRHPGHHHLYFVPDFRQTGRTAENVPIYRDDMDRLVGMAMTHPGTMVFVDEAHELFPAGQTPPHSRRALRQGRHARLSLVLTTPRPMTIDPLVLSQADWVFVFALPNPADRRRVAETIGWDPKDFDQAVRDLGTYEYLRYEAAADGGQGELLHCPPLPAEHVRHHAPG